MSKQNQEHAPEAEAPEEVKVSPETEEKTADTGSAAEWKSAEEAAVPPETVQEPEVQLSPDALLQAEVAQLKDQLLRKEADFQNYRKRMAKEIGDARRVGLCDTVTPFLQLFDLFSMAMKAANTSDNVAALKQGLEMILAQYAKALDELGVQKFDADGADFDPMLHDAVSYEHSAEIPEGKVIKQWNCGYKLGERLLRPARVIVSSGPEPEKTPEQEEK